MISAPYNMMAPQPPFASPFPMAPQQPFSGYPAPQTPAPWIQALQPHMAQPSSSAPSPAPSTSTAIPSSGAVNLIFTAPVSNNPGAPAAAPTGGDSFRRSSGSPFTPNPYADPRQQLMDAYQNAEKARNDYLNFANQLNGQAYQNQNAYPFGQNPFAANQYNPYAAQQYQQNLQQLQQQQQWQQMMQQQQQMQQMMQQQQPQQQQPPMPPQPQGLSTASFPELNAMIAQPQSPNDKMQALNEIAMRGQGDAETYELLSDAASTPMQGLAQEDADQIRRAALMALGTTAQMQNAQIPIRQLPGMEAIKTIITNKNESPAVKAEAVRTLRMINETPGRPTRSGWWNKRQDRKLVEGLIKIAKKDKNPDVQSAVKDPIMPPGGMMGMPPGGDGMMGMPPEMMNNPQGAY